MAIRAVGFPSRGYKIRKIFAYESNHAKKIIEFCELGPGERKIQDEQ